MENPFAILIMAVVALFTDGFIYGLIIPLTPHSPAGITQEWMLGALYTSYSVGVIAVTLLYGLLSGRIGSSPYRRPMLLGAGIQTLAVIIFATATNFPLVLFAKALQGAAAGIAWTAGLALMAECFNKNRAKMMGVAMMGGTIGLVVGPMVGGFLFDWHGYRFPFAVAAIFSLLDGLLRWVLIKDKVGSQGGKKTSWGPLLRDRQILLANGIIILGGWCWCVLESLFPNHLEQRFHASPSTIGLLFTIGNLTYALICPMTGALADRLGPWKTIRWGCVLMACLLPLVSFPDSIMGVGFLLMLVNIFYAFMMNPAMSELGEVADGHGSNAYTLVYAIYNIAYSIGMVGSGIMSGVLASTFSLRATLLLTSLMIALGLCINLISTLIFKKKEFLPLPNQDFSLPIS